MARTEHDRSRQGRARGAQVKKREVFLSEKQTAFLKAEAKRLGIPVNEVVRRLLDKHIDEIEQKLTEVGTTL